MQAQFYLMNLSFRLDPEASTQEIEDGVKQLAADFRYIRHHQDRVYRHESIFEEELIPEYRIMDLYDVTKPCPLSRDVKQYLRIVIDHSRPTNWSNEEIIELITQQEQEDLCASGEVYGLLALRMVPHEIPEVYIVYNQRDWFSFHRYFLGNFPCSESYFVKECEKCFPKLFIHLRNESTLGQMSGDWLNFSRSIVFHLTQLNDVFPHYLHDTTHYQRIEALNHFSAQCRVEASPQGNADAKPRMTFTFEDEDGVEVPVCCEPHMKLSRSDRGGDNTYYYNRIYFHEGHPSIQSGKILIGHIGRHIDFD